MSGTNELIIGGKVNLKELPGRRKVGTRREAGTGGGGSGEPVRRGEHWVQYHSKCLCRTAFESRIPVRYPFFARTPNTFNPKTVISCQGQAVSDVRLVVDDLLGREVAVLMNERKAPGRYEVRFDASRLSSGVCPYRLSAGSFVQSRKMVMVK
jgi:hypothetical protein